MDGSRALDELAPQVRFLVRAVAAGLSAEEAGSILRLDAETVRRHLRSAVREVCGAPPSPALGDETLLAALEPALRAPSQRRPSTACPSADVAQALADGSLDGPLLLAEAEHAADCAACRTALVARRRAGPSPAAPGPEPSRRALWIGVAIGSAAATWALLG